MKKIMFNDKMCLTQAVIEGRKTQIRRIITPQPTYKDDSGICWKGYAYGLRPVDFNEPFGSYMNFVSGTEYDKSCRRYRKGEVVAVAQAYKTLGYNYYALDISPKDFHISRGILGKSKGWNNKMFVRAEGCKHKIRITDVRVERLQDISDEDCLKEGVRKVVNENGIYVQYYVGKGDNACSFENPREAFAHLINKVSRKDVWSENPYVFVYDFELVR